VLAAAVALADTGGLAALSLPRLAEELGLTTTALYRYVASKEELVALAADAAVTPPPASDPAAGWRAGARSWTRGAVDLYSARPWLLDVPVRAPVTPGSLRWLEAFLRVTAPLPLHVAERVQCATLLDGHARGVATLRRDLSTGSPAYPPDVVAALLPLLPDRGYPEVAALLAGVGDHPGAAADGLAEVGDFGTDRILDGIAALARDRGAAPR
jgi:AcrR family transcriptional regulator